MTHVIAGEPAVATDDHEVVIQSLWLLCGLVACSAVVGWFSDGATHGGMLAATVQSLATRAGARLSAEQVHALMPGRTLEREVWTGLTEGVKAVVVAFVFQGLLLLFGREARISRLLGIVAVAGIVFVARDLLHACLIARSAPPTTRLLLTNPLALAWLTSNGAGAAAPTFQIANAINPFDALWCAVIIRGLSQFESRRVTRTAVVCSVWAASLALRVASYWFLIRALS